MIDLSVSSLKSEDQMIISDPVKEKPRFDHKVNKKGLEFIASRPNNFYISRLVGNKGKFELCSTT
jgi:hypothetical protein